MTFGSCEHHQIQTADVVIFGGIAILFYLKEPLWWLLLMLPVSTDLTGNGFMIMVVLMINGIPVIMDPYIHAGGQAFNLY